VFQPITDRGLVLWGFALVRGCTRRWIGWNTIYFGIFLSMNSSVLDWLDCSFLYIEFCIFDFNLTMLVCRCWCRWSWRDKETPVLFYHWLECKYLQEHAFTMKKWHSYQCVVILKVFFYALFVFRNYLEESFTHPSNQPLGDQTTHSTLTQNLQQKLPKVHQLIINCVWPEPILTSLGA